LLAAFRCALRLICPRAAGTGLAHHRRWPDQKPVRLMA
jgi:hypothetical protein